MANDAGPEAKQWALAATAILTTMTRREPRHDLLGGAAKSPEAEGVAKTILANSWGVDGRDKLISTLEFLGSAGHTADYQKAAATFAQAPPQQRAQDPSLAFVNQYGTEIGNRGLVAWDLGRAIAVAGWGYLAGFCSEDEAWGALLSNGVRLRGMYGSWDEYAKHYRLGALFWDANAVGQIDAILGQLMSAPNSPWRTVSWSLDGPAPAGAAQGGGFPAPAGYAPPDAPGAPQYGGVAPVAPPAGGGPVIPPGQPGAPLSYGGVPVIAPPPGGGGMAPIPGAPLGAPGAPGGGGSKKGLIIGLAIAGVVVLVIVIALIVHHMHKAPEHEHEHAPPPPAQHEEKHEGKKGKH